jgi:hypothetical protein
VHPPAQLLAQRPLLERRQPQRGHQVAATELSQYARVDLVGLASQRRDVTDLARVRDLHPPARGGKLVPDPDRATHHLDTRSNIDTELQNEPREPVLVSGHDTFTSDRATLTDSTPRRPPIRPIDPDILHRGASLRGLIYRPTLSLLGGPPS